MSITHMIRRGRAIATLAAVLLATLLAACAPTVTPASPDATATPSSENALEGTEWVLTSLRGKPLLEGTHITLSFEDKWLSGFAGCNAYGGGPDSGGYAVADDGTLTLPQLAITVMACPSPEGVMEQEQAYVEALRSTASYRLADGHLEIRDAAGETILVFARQEEYAMNPTDLLGTAWQLVSMDGRFLAEGSTISLAFHDEHRASGYAGCRDYVAQYEAQGDELGFYYTGMGPVCPSSALLEQEGNYTTILSWVNRYRLAEDRLELHTVRGEALIFEFLPEAAQPALEGPTWELLAFVEENAVEEMPASLPLSTDLLAETEITLALSDGTTRGSAGCNTYQAAYARDGVSLNFEAIAVTEMACLDPEGVMEQEQRYLDFLRGVTAYHIYGAQLWLETGDGQALVFTAWQ
jgi:heat shock protein HslJ